MTLTRPMAISLGFVYVYLVPADDGCVLVDTGVPGQEDKILASLAKHGLSPEEIRLIFLTHVHGDHIGGLKTLVKRSHAPVLTHRTEATFLSSGSPLYPRGFTMAGKLFAAVISRFVRAAAGFAYSPDVVVDDECSLAEFGVRGRAIHTPGHTGGSLTLLLDTGEAFTGDLCAKFGLFSGGSYVPFLGEDREAIYASWRRLIHAGAKQIYPAHGAPFSADILAEELARSGRA